MVGSYDYRLVLLSIFIALISSLAAFVFVGRVSRNKAMIAKAWLVLGAISMGSGIWAMHFINMLAFSLPTPTGYGLDDTVLSWLIAVSISWLGLDIASRPGLKVQRLMAAGVIMGLGVAAMHYTGMHAMQMFPAITYDKPLLLLSILVSIVAAVIALFMLFKTSNQPGQNTLRNRLIAACVMAAGICGTHYLGMAAAEFHPYAVCATVSALPASLFAIIIALGSSALILFASILAIMDTQQDDPASRLLADTQERLTRMNMLDVVTQLPNRQYFLRHLGIGIRRTTRLGNALAVAVIKLENLKGLASSLGEPVREEILRKAGKRLQQTIRGCDMAAYQDHDEFLVLFEDIKNEQDIMPVMQRIIDILRSNIAIEHHDIKLTVRAGIALYPVHGDADRLLTYAQAAMNRIKPGDGPGYRLFDARLEPSSYDLLETHQDLHNALARNEMVLYFEPRATIFNQTMTSLEVQLRWQHPTKGMIPSATFAPMAESLGLMQEISNWLLEETCVAIKQLRSQHITLPVCLPLMAAQLRLPDLAERIAGLMQSHDLPKESLLLELPESAFMQQPEQYAELVKQLPGAGIRLSLENFGTRYSFLPYLQNLPLRQLKLDQQFTADLAANHKSRAIAGAIIELAHAHGVKVIAEHVSTAEERQILGSLDCDELQGFIYANPAPLAQLQPLLKPVFPNSQSDVEGSTTSSQAAWDEAPASLSVLHS